MTFRRRLFEIVQPDCGTSAASRAFDRAITLLILASVAAVFAATFDLPEGVSRALELLERVASVAFTAEYAIRVATADFLYPGAGRFASRIRYATSAMALVDLAAVLPFWLPMFLPGSMLGLRALRLVRLLRIFKLNRYFDAIKTIGDVIAAKKRELVGSVFFVAVLMLVSSLLMYSAEHEAQPGVFRNAFSGLWWAVATITTVGYGDIYPVTWLGRVVGAVIAFSGVAAVAVPTGIITAGLSERISKEDKAAGGDAVMDEVLRCVHRQGEELERMSKALERLAKDGASAPSDAAFS